MSADLAMPAQNRRPVMIMAGGTGGHIFPGLAVAAELGARGIPVTWLGAAGGLETRLVPEHGIALDTIAIGGVRGKGLHVRLAAPWRILRAVLAAHRILEARNPRSVLALGGYVAGPGGVAAWLARRPLIVQEQNRIPGFTNRLLARLASRVLAGFADAFPAALDAEWSGNPVRAEIAALASPATRLAGRSGRARVLVLGGSLGARALNLGVPRAVALLDPALRPEIRHQAGARGLEEARAAYAEAAIEATVEPFIADMAEAYACADFVICRAGALTLAELAAAGVGALLVPYPHAVDDHQTHNGARLVEVGAARMLQERELSPATLAAELAAVLNDRARLLAMAEAARSLAKPDAARTIAARCVEIAA